MAVWGQTSLWPQVLKQAPYICLFLTVMAPGLSFYTVHKPLGFAVSLSSLYHIPDRSHFSVTHLLILVVLDSGAQWQKLVLFSSGWLWKQVSGGPCL